MLKGKQQRFVEEYLKDFNATQAAIRSGYSKKTAGVIGDENLKKPNIKEEIDRRKQKVTQKNEVTVERVVKELARIAFFDPRKLIEGDNLKHIKDLDDDTAAAVGGVEIETRIGPDGKEIIKTKLRICNKNDAAKQLATYLEMFKGKGESGDVASALEKYFQRADEIAERYSKNQPDKE